MGSHKNGAGKRNLKTCARFLKGRNHKNIERAHRVLTANRNPSATAPPFLVAKITNSEMSEKIKSAIIKAN